MSLSELGFECYRREAVVVEYWEICSAMKRFELCKSFRMRGGVGHTRIKHVGFSVGVGILVSRDFVVYSH